MVKVTQLELWNFWTKKVNMYFERFLSKRADKTATEYHLIQYLPFIDNLQNQEENFVNVIFQVRKVVQLDGTIRQMLVGHLAVF